MLKPDLEDTANELDCEYCKKYWHYSFSYKDESKRGKPVLTHGGKSQERKEDNPTDCEHCPRSITWNEENEAIYGEYMRNKHTRKTIKDNHLADCFSVLDEEMARINAHMISNAVAAPFEILGAMNDH